MYDWCNEAPRQSRGLSLCGVLRSSNRDSDVGDSGFEPLTSSASKKYYTLLEISAVYNIAANHRISALTHF
jgi:hypothetical protein